MKDARHLHVPYPGDIFSQNSRSAVLTVAKQLARERIRSGRRAQLVAREGVIRPDWDGPEVIEALRHKVPSDGLPHYVDIALGWTFGVRPLTAISFTGLPQDENSIVFIHGQPSGLSAVRHGRRVLYVHNDSFARLTKRESHRVGRTADAIVSVSADLASRFPDFSCPIIVVPNGADTTVFHPNGREDDNPTLEEHEDLRITFLGRVRSEKGVHILLEAALPLARKNVPYQLDIVGADGQVKLTKFEKELRRAAAAQGASVRFIRNMNRADLPKYLRSRDVLVVPSIWNEPSGLVVAEGVASGLAVVASKVGGIPEVAGDACTYVTPGHIQELSEVLMTFAESREFLIKAKYAAMSRDVSWKSAYRKLNSEIERVIR